MDTISMAIYFLDPVWTCAAASALRMHYLYDATLSELNLMGRPLPLSYLSPSGGGVDDLI